MSLAFVYDQIYQFRRLTTLCNVLLPLKKNIETTSTIQLINWPCRDYTSLDILLMSSKHENMVELQYVHIKNRINCILFPPVLSWVCYFNSKLTLFPPFLSWVPYFNSKLANPELPFEPTIRNTSTSAYTAQTSQAMGAGLDK